MEPALNERKIIAENFAIQETICNFAATFGQIDFLNKLSYLN